MGLVVVGFATFVLQSPSAQAAVDLLRWDIYTSNEFLADAANGHNNDGAYSSVTSAKPPTGVEFSALTRGAGWGPASSPSAWEARGRGLFTSRSGWTQTSLATAVAKQDYFQFIVAPSNGYALSLSTLNLSLYEQIDRNSTVVVEYSTDQFATYTALPAITNITATWAGTLTTLSLINETALQNMTSAVTFRVYGYGFDGSDHGLGRGSGSNTDLSVVGTIATVPEVASLGTMLAGLAGACCLRRATRRRV